jgi:hypothetical protein
MYPIDDIHRMVAPAGWIDAQFDLSPVGVEARTTR